MAMTSLAGPVTLTFVGSASGAPLTTYPAAGVPTTETCTGTSLLMRSSHSTSIPAGSNSNHLEARPRRPVHHARLERDVARARAAQVDLEAERARAEVVELRAPFP
jgi:hypothetical protein